jgi:multidrug efflux pump
MDEIERRLMPYTESGEAIRLLVRAPRIFGSFQIFNSGIAILVLNDFADRRSAWVIMDESAPSSRTCPGSRPSR